MVRVNMNNITAVKQNSLNILTSAVCFQTVSCVTDEPFRSN